MTTSPPQLRWHRYLALVVVLATLLGLLPGGVSAASHTVRFSVSDDVSAQDESYVREGISLAEDYLRDWLDAEIDDDLIVNVRDTADPSDDSTLAFANGDFLVVFTGSPYWDTLAPSLRMETVIHEYVHIYQFDTLGDDEDASPMWFIEGMAEYLAFDAIAKLGIVDPRAVADYQAWAVLSTGYEVKPLPELEEVWDFQSADGPIYPLSYLAVSRLVGELPSKRLERYIDAIGNGATWREAFPDAFGLEVDAFYAEFGTWLKNDLLAPSRIPTQFREIYAVDQEAPVDIVSSSDEIIPGDQALVVAETERGSACSFTLRDENGERMATLQTFADRTGLVFWLVTIPESSPAGRSEVMVDCGDKRDRVKLEILPDD